jgi:hypothetical protein
LRDCSVGVPPASKGGVLAASFCLGLRSTNTDRDGALTRRQDGRALGSPQPRSGLEKIALGCGGQRGATQGKCPPRFFPTLKAVAHRSHRVVVGSIQHSFNIEHPMAEARKAIIGFIVVISNPNFERRAWTRISTICVNLRPSAVSSVLAPFVPSVVPRLRREPLMQIKVLPCADHYVMVADSN